MNKKDSKIIKKSKKLNKSKKVIKNTKSTKSIKDKSVKQHVNVNVTSGGGGGGSSAPHPFLNSSRDTRGEDVLLQKLTDLIITNKSNKPIMTDSSTATFNPTNEIGIATFNPTNEIGTSTFNPTNEIGTSTFNEMIDANNQIDGKFNSLFEPSSNIKVETKPDTNNQNLLENVLTVQNTPSKRTIVEGPGYTMFQPMQNNIPKSIFNKDSIINPSREEYRALRNLKDYTALDPYNESAIIPINDVKSEQPKVPPKEVEILQPKEVEQKQNKPKNINRLIPSQWVKKYELKPYITSSEYKELKSYMTRYKEANTAEKTKITKQMIKDFYPKIKK